MERLGQERPGRKSCRPQRTARSGSGRGSLQETCPSAEACPEQKWFGGRDSPSALWWQQPGEVWPQRAPRQMRRGCPGAVSVRGWRSTAPHGYLCATVAVQVPEGALRATRLPSLHPLRLLGFPPWLFLSSSLLPWTAGVMGRISGGTCSRYRCRHVLGPGTRVLLSAHDSLAGWGGWSQTQAPLLRRAGTGKRAVSSVRVAARWLLVVGGLQSPRPDGLVPWSPGGVRGPFPGANEATPWCLEAELVAMAPGLCTEWLP